MVFLHYGIAVIVKVDVLLKDLQRLTITSMLLSTDNALSSPTPPQHSCIVQIAPVHPIKPQNPLPCGIDLPDVKTTPAMRPSFSAIPEPVTIKMPTPCGFGMATA